MALLLALGQISVATFVVGGLVAVLIASLTTLLHRWGAEADDGSDDSDDSDGGGGSKRGGGPVPPGGGEPAWWPDFEREFREYVRASLQPSPSPWLTSR